MGLRKWYSAVSAAGDQQLPHEYPVCVCTVLLPTPENIAYPKVLSDYRYTHTGSEKQAAEPSDKVL